MSCDALPSARLCCPRFIGTMAPSDSLPATRHFTLRAYRFVVYDFYCRAGEGLPSSRHNCPYMPIPLHRRILPCCHSKFSARSLVFAISHVARLPLVPSGSMLTMRQDSLDVTACKVASFPKGKLFTGLQPSDFADVCLLATGRLGPYPDRTCTG